MTKDIPAKTNEELEKEIEIWVNKYETLKTKTNLKLNIAQERIEMRDIDIKSKDHIISLQQRLLEK